MPNERNPVADTTQEVDKMADSNQEAMDMGKSVVEFIVKFDFRLVEAGFDMEQRRTIMATLVNTNVGSESDTLAAPEGAMVAKMAQQLLAVRNVVNGYYAALDNHKHGGIAESHAFNEIQKALDMQWVRGASKKN